MSGAAEWFDQGVKAAAAAQKSRSAARAQRALQQAIDAFDQVLRLDSGHVAALTQRGLAQAQLGQHDAALDSFVAASAKQPDDVQPLVGAARSLLQLGRADDALKTFERALALRPDELDAQAGRAEVLMAKGDFERALGAWDRLLAATDANRARRTLAHRGRVLALGALDRPEGLAAFRDRVKSELGGLVPAELRPALLRAMEPERPELTRHAYQAWREAHVRAPEPWRQVWLDAAGTWSVLSSFAQAWLTLAERDEREGKLAHAVYDCERALELWPKFTAAAAKLEALKRRQDGGRWVVMRSDRYARENTEVGEYASRAAAEARVRELNADGEGEYWAAPTS